MLLIHAMLARSTFTALGALWGHFARALRSYLERGLRGAIAGCVCRLWLLGASAVVVALIDSCCCAGLPPRGPLALRSQAPRSGRRQLRPLHTRPRRAPTLRGLVVRALIKIACFLRRVGPLVVRSGGSAMHWLWPNTADGRPAAEGALPRVSFLEVPPRPSSEEELHSPPLSGVPLRATGGPTPSASASVSKRFIALGSGAGEV